MPPERDIVQKAKIIKDAIEGEQDDGSKLSAADALELARQLKESRVILVVFPREQKLPPSK